MISIFMKSWINIARSLVGAGPEGRWLLGVGWMVGSAVTVLQRTRGFAPSPCGWCGRSPLLV